MATIHEIVQIEPPEGGAPQDLLSISMCAIRIPVVTKIDSGFSIFSMYCRSDSSCEITLSVGTVTKTFEVTSEWARIEFEATTIDDIYVNSISSSVVYLYKAQLEMGSKTTDWRPAPEDAEEEIANANENYGNLDTKIDEFKEELDRVMVLDDPRGFVIRLYNQEDGTYGTWEYIMNEESNWIFNNQLQIKTFEIIRDTVTPRKLAFTDNDQTIIAKSDGRGGVVWVKG